MVHVGPRTDEEIKELVDQASSSSALRSVLASCVAAFREERMLAWLQLRTIAFLFVVYTCTAWGPHGVAEGPSSAASASLAPARESAAAMRSSAVLRSTPTSGKTLQWKCRCGAHAKRGETLTCFI